MRLEVGGNRNDVPDGPLPPHGPARRRVSRSLTGQTGSRRDGMGASDAHLWHSNPSYSLTSPEA